MTTVLAVFLLVFAAYHWYDKSQTSRLINLSLSLLAVVALMVDKGRFDPLLLVFPLAWFVRYLQDA